MVYVESRAIEVRRLRDTLVAAEVALTLALLFGAALLGRSLLRVSEVPLGFDPYGVVTADLSLPAGRYDGAAAHARFYERVLDQLSAVPGITAAGVTGALPLSPTAATFTPRTSSPDGPTARPSTFSIRRTGYIPPRTRRDCPCSSRRFTDWPGWTSSA